VSVDGNKDMFSIAFDVEECEWKDSWKPFLVLMGDALKFIHEWKI